MDYRDDSVDPDHRFDRVETTLSHLLREPHPALDGRAYGPALLDGLERVGLGRPQKVIEVGGGTGWLAKTCLQADPKLEWWCLDVSRPALFAQRARSQNNGGPTAFLRARAESLPLADGSFDGLVLANEVIADLPVSEGPGGALFNSGAQRFVQEVARVLAPGGRAALTEFGGEAEVTAVPMWGELGECDHVEHTIRFPDLAESARAAGLVARTLRLFDLLGIDGSVRVASYTDLRRLAALRRQTPMVACTMDEIRRRHPLLTRLFDFDFPRLDSRRFPDAHGPVGAAEAFWALLLEKPRA